MVLRAKCGCVKFREKEDSDVDYVEIIKALHPIGSKFFPCTAHVGRKGGRQFVYIGDPSVCIHDGFTAHLLLHVFGVIHEIHRKDRDEYVDIDYSNVKEKRAFLKLDIVPLYGPYDFGSVTHYGSDESAIDPSKPTVICKKAESECKKMGQLVDLSAIDRQKLRAMYDCPEPSQ